jgi:hypothetical protein
MDSMNTHEVLQGSGPISSTPDLSHIDARTPLLPEDIQAPGDGLEEPTRQLISYLKRQLTDKMRQRARGQGFAKTISR